MASSLSAYRVARGRCVRCGKVAHAIAHAPMGAFVGFEAHTRELLADAFARITCPDCGARAAMDGPVVAMTDAEYDRWQTIR